MANESIGSNIHGLETRVVSAQVGKPLLRSIFFTGSEYAEAQVYNFNFKESADSAWYRNVTRVGGSGGGLLSLSLSFFPRGDTAADTKIREGLDAQFDACGLATVRAWCEAGIHTDIPTDAYRKFCERTIPKVSALVNIPRLGNTNAVTIGYTQAGAISGVPYVAAYPGVSAAAMGLQGPVLHRYNTGIYGSPYPAESYVLYGPLGMGESKGYYSLYGGLGYIARAAVTAFYYSPASGKYVVEASLACSRASGSVSAYHQNDYFEEMISTSYTSVNTRGYDYSNTMADSNTSVDFYRKEVTAAELSNGVLLQVQVVGTPPLLDIINGSADIPVSCTLSLWGTTTTLAATYVYRRSVGVDSSYLLVHETYAYPSALTSWLHTVVPATGSTLAVQAQAQMNTYSMDAAATMAPGLGLVYMPEMQIPVCVPTETTEYLVEVAGVTRTVTVATRFQADASTGVPTRHARVTPLVSYAWVDTSVRSLIYSQGYGSGATAVSPSYGYVVAWMLINCGEATDQSFLSDLSYAYGIDFSGCSTIHSEVSYSILAPDKNSTIVNVAQGIVLRSSVLLDTSLDDNEESSGPLGYMSWNTYNGELQSIPNTIRDEQYHLANVPGGIGSPYNSTHHISLSADYCAGERRVSDIVHRSGTYPYGPIALGSRYSAQPILRCGGRSMRVDYTSTVTATYNTVLSETRACTAPAIGARYLATPYSSGLQVLSGAATSTEDDPITLDLTYGALVGTTGFSTLVFRTAPALVLNYRALSPSGTSDIVTVASSSGSATEKNLRRSVPVSYYLPAFVGFDMLVLEYEVQGGEVNGIEHSVSSVYAGVSGECLGYVRPAGGITQIYKGGLLVAGACVLTPALADFPVPPLPHATDDDGLDLGPVTPVDVEVYDVYLRSVGINAIVLSFRLRVPYSMSLNPTTGALVYDPTYVDFSNGVGVHVVMDSGVDAPNLGTSFEESGVNQPYATIRSHVQVPTGTLPPAKTHRGYIRAYSTRPGYPRKYSGWASFQIVMPQHDRGAITQSSQMFTYDLSYLSNSNSRVSQVGGTTSERTHSYAPDRYIYPNIGTGQTPVSGLFTETGGQAGGAWVALCGYSAVSAGSGYLAFALPTMLKGGAATAYLATAEATTYDSTQSLLGAFLQAVVEEAAEEPDAANEYAALTGYLGRVSTYLSDNTPDNQKTGEAPFNAQIIYSAYIYEYMQTIRVFRNDFASPELLFWASLSPTSFALLPVSATLATTLEPVVKVIN